MNKVGTLAANRNGENIPTAIGTDLAKDVFVCVCTPHGICGVPHVWTANRQACDALPSRLSAKS